MGSSDIKLPAQWCVTKLDDVYQIYGGGTPTTSKPEYWGGETPWITSADIEGVRAINVRKYVTEKGIENSTTTKAPKNSLLVVTRVGLGKIAIIKEETCFSQDLQALVMSDELLVPEYTLYLLSYKLQFLKYEGRGTTISGLTKKQLKDLEYPLPPFKEQHRIVAKIEELFSELDKGIESLKTAREQLKVYRQALLKHAFEGKLTEQWRKENADKLETADDVQGCTNAAGAGSAGAAQLLERIKQEREARYQQQLEDWKAAVKQWEADGKEGKKPSMPKKLQDIALDEEVLSQLPTLTGNLTYICLGHLIDEPKYGTSKKCTYDTNGTGVLRIPNVVSGRIDADDLKYAEFDKSELEEYSLQHGDLLTIRSNGSVSIVGKAALIESKNSHFIYAGYLIRLRPNSNVLNSKYLLFSIESHMLRKQIEAKAKSTSGVNNINSGEIKSLIVPIMDLAEQEKIVEILEEKLSVVDNSLIDIDGNLRKSEALRQSILKKAFSGQLVPQDPNDEPASVLLDRIAKEKEEAAARAKQARKKKEAAKKKPKTTRTSTRKAS